MTIIELVQTGLMVAGVGIGGGIWYRLGRVEAKHDDLRARVTNLETYRRLTT